VNQSSETLFVVVESGFLSGRSAVYERISIKFRIENCSKIET